MAVLGWLLARPRRLSRRTEGSGSETTPTIALNQRVSLGLWSFNSLRLSSGAPSLRRGAAARGDQLQRSSGEGARTGTEEPATACDHCVLPDI